MKEETKSTVQIKHRTTGNLICEGETIRGAMCAAVKNGVNLTDANLAFANLTGANLTGANLADANLTDANLTGANLARANLTGANLARANLTGVDLTGVNLTGANLTFASLTGVDLTGANLARANLTGTNLTRADLADANLAGANLIGVNLARADLTGAKGLPIAPVVENIDAAILSAICNPGCKLNMSAWHTCETTHCLAGWAIHLAGEEGYELEKKTSSPTAGRLIFESSRKDGSYPDFYASKEDAIKDLENRVKCDKK